MSGDLRPDFCKGLAKFIASRGRGYRLKLANDAGVSGSSISHITGGSRLPSYDMAEDLSRAIGTTIEELARVGRGEIEVGEIEFTRPAKPTVHSALAPQETNLDHSRDLLIRAEKILTSGNLRNAMALAGVIDALCPPATAEQPASSVEQAPLGDEALRGINLLRGNPVTCPDCDAVIATVGEIIDGFRSEDDVQTISCASCGHDFDLAKFPNLVFQPAPAEATPELANNPRRARGE